MSAFPTTPRRSIIGPLFIILLGLLLLAQNLLPDVSVWLIFVEHWPWLLIGWGAFRLLEHALAAARGEPGPRPMGAGALVLALLLCGVGSAARAVHKAEWGEGFRLFWTGFKVFHPTHSIQIEHSWPAHGIQALRINDFAGRITIAGDDEASIRLTGRRNISSESLTAARTLSDGAPTDLVIDGETAVLRPSGASPRAFSGDITVRAPKALAVTLLDGDGRVRLQGFDASAVVRLERGGAVVARDIAGDFTLEGRARSLEAERIGGAVRLDGQRLEELDVRSTGPLEISARRLTVKAPGGLPGRITVHRDDIVIDGVDGALEVEGRNRTKIRASGLGGPTRLIAQRGDIRATLDHTPLSDLEVRLDSGDIRLTLPPDGAYDLEAHADEVDSKLPPARAIASEASPAGVRPRVKATTGRGRVRLHPLE